MTTTETKALTITRHLRCPLTTEEANEKKDELVRTLNDLERLEEHFAGLKAQHQATVKARQGTIKTLSHDLGAGFLMRPVSCQQIVNLEKNTIVTTRFDTGEQIEERALSKEEMVEARKGKKP